MTDIEQKGQALLAEIRDEASKLIEFNAPTYQHLTRWADCVEALCRAIEQHEAFKREVSDAVEGYTSMVGLDPKRYFARFIIAKPDPLVEAINSAPYLASAKETADHIRAAIEARGGRIVWEKQP